MVNYMTSQVSKIFVLMTITFMIASMAFVGQASAEHTWTEEVLDYAEAAGFASSIRIDGSNNPVVAYGSIHGLNYTVKSGSTWTNEQVFKNMTFDTDLKMDSSGNPHIACIIGDYFTEGIKYASKSGGTWTNTTILDNVHTEGYISLELTGSNNPYILCQLADSGKTLALFYESGGNWIQENITLYGGWESYDMAIGGGSIHVVYENASSNEIYYASRPVSGGSWQFEKLMDGGITSGAVSMDVDSSGNPHILIGFQHMWNDGSSWLSEPLDMVYSGMDYLDLYIDSSDNLHAAIHVSYSLIYGQKTSSTWEFEAVRTDMDGNLCSVVADSTGMPHITHYSVNNDNLKYHAGTALAADSDGDGLLDSWEIANLGDLSQDGTDDPDSDGHDNLDEYINGTDPMDRNDPGAASTDTDADGLPDTWENSNFGNLNQGATDDPDSDGHDNLDEYNEGTDPMDATDPWVDTSDTDGDGLPDTWENTHFGNLDQDATDDPDNDLFDNEDEYISGTDPNDPDSTPLDLGLDILNSIIFWAVIGIIVIVLVVILIIYLFVKAVHDDDVPISQHYDPPPPPVYAYPPPPLETEAPPMFCPNCGNSLADTPTPGKNYCSKCGTYI